MKYKIMVTSAGGSPSTGVIRSLRKTNFDIEIVGLDADKYTILRSEADRNYLVPLGSDKNYLNIILEIKDKENPDFFHCQNSSEIVYVSKYRDDLEMKTFLPKHNSVLSCTDKFQSYKLWKKRGIKVPETILVKNLKTLKDFMIEHSGSWLRNTTGSAGRGSLPTKNINSAKSWIDMNNGWGRFTASKILRKDSVTWMSIWKNGNLIACQGRKRHYWEFSNRTLSGVTGITGLGSTYSDRELDEISIKSIKAIDKDPHGIWCVDLTYDEEGIPNPTEINIGRFFTTVLFFTEAGFNFPEILLKCALDLPLPSDIPIMNPCKENLYWLRGMDFLPRLLEEKEVRKYG